MNMMSHIIEQYIHVFIVGSTYQVFQFLIGAKAVIHFRRRNGPVAVITGEFGLFRSIISVGFFRILIYR